VAKQLLQPSPIDTREVYSGFAACKLQQVYKHAKELKLRIIKSGSNNLPIIGASRYLGDPEKRPQDTSKTDIDPAFRWHAL